MGRANVIYGLVARLQGVSGFDADSNGTAVVNDDRVLSMGVDRAAIVMANHGEGRLVAGRPGNAAGLIQMGWDLDCQLFVRHPTMGNLAEARDAADVYAQAIIDRIDADPTLGGSARDAYVLETQVQDEAFDVAGQPFLLEVLTVRCTEHLNRG